MLSLLRRKKSPEVAVASIEQQIYNDVYSAQSLILEEAKRILAIPPVFDSAKAERLRQLEKLGFSNFDEVKKLKEEREQHREYKELDEMINYYNRIYPLHRFISQKSVQIIIKKYNLLLANAGDYIAEIPEKNQQEIVNFKIRRNDIRKPSEMDEGWMSIMIPRPIYFPDLDYLFHKTLAEESGDPEKYFQDLEQEKKRKRLAYEREMLPGKHLLIIAPQHKLDTNGKVIIDGILRPNKDPIVLQPVTAGYLIVSSWGLEASDPLVVNAINN